MSQPRAAYRVDSNQAEIVQALRAIGASVTVIAGVGGGCPDLLVGFNGTNYLFEVKAPHGAKFTEAEYELKLAWGSSVFIVTSTEEAVDIVRTNPRELKY